MSAKSLFEKVWDRHIVVPETADTPAILYIDLHLVHEVTSPPGVQPASRCRPQGASAGPDALHDGSLHADDSGRFAQGI